MTVRGYLIKEIFGPTIQGEGAHAGRACVFLRFAACNLACTWCDTDFAPDGAQRMQADEIVRTLCERDVHHTRLVIVTGGEPSLQWDPPLAAALASVGFRVHMESNGTHLLTAPVDWLTISPKPQFHIGKIALAAQRGDEIKVVVDATVNATTLRGYEARYPGASYFLQPCMDADHATHLQRTIALALENPRWRVGIQMHKLLGVA